MLRTLARMCLSVVFINGGWHAFSEPGSRPGKVEQFGIPEPERAVILNGGIMMLAGSALALEVFPRLAALTLLGSLIPTTIVGHAFWREKDAAGRNAQSTQFAKNLGLIGGLLLVLLDKGK